jgi:outer membrane protein OmpA-like peptidoglycan-associated protein
MNAARFHALMLSTVLAFAAQALPAATPTVDPEAENLSAQLAALDADPATAGRARLERFQAGQALAALQSARSRDRAQALLLAQSWVATAQDAAQAEALAEQSSQLDRERDQLMLDASRREAELARREAERLRTEALAQAEENARLAAAQEQERLQAEQAVADADATASQAVKLAQARDREDALAKKQAELSAALAEDDGTSTPPPSRMVGKRRVYTLPGSAFASGSASLNASAKGSLRALAAELGKKRNIRIEAHTDSQGADAANLALSQKRAEAVRQALQSQGIPAARLSAAGKGETDPLTGNDSPEGRARNRRVEISVE